MARKRAALMIFTSIGLVLVAFTGFPVSAASNLSLGRATPTAVSTPVDNTILFQDDFETYSNRWTQQESPKASVKYDEGALHARIVSPGVAVWSVPDFEVPLHNYRVEVDVHFLDGGMDSQFGFVLDYVDDDDFYALIATLDGGWLLMHQDSGEWIDLTDTEDAETVEIESDAPVIRLAAEIIDGSLKLYLDDQLVSSTTNDSVSGGLFGLFARAGKGYTNVVFDNIVVTDIE